MKFFCYYYFLLFLLFRGIFAKIIIRKLEKFVSKTTNQFDIKLVESLKGPVKFFPLVIGFFIASNYLDFEGKSLLFIENVNRSLMTIIIFGLSIRLLSLFHFLLKKLKIFYLKIFCIGFYGPLKLLLLF